MEVFMSSNTLDIVTRPDGDTMVHSELSPMFTHLMPVHDTSSPRQAKPVLFVADADPVLRRGLTAALKRRFGADYLVHSAATPEAGLRALRRLHDEAAEVALVIADLWLPGTGGVEFLAQARECYPRAQSIVLTTIGDDAVSESLQRALALGRPGHAQCHPVWVLSNGLRGRTAPFG
jgi:CheY-like chemotaxis protein